MKHIDNMAKIILLTGTIVGYAYGMEFFIAWYSARSTKWTPSSSAPRPLRWAYWIMISAT
jgi:hypothetical protein